MVSLLHEYRYQNMLLDSWPLYIIAFTIVVDKVIKYYREWKSNDLLERKQIKINSMMEFGRTIAGVVAFLYLRGELKKLDERMQLITSDIFKVEIGKEKWKEVESLIKVSVEEAMEKRRKNLSDKIEQMKKDRDVFEKDPPTDTSAQDTYPPPAPRSGTNSLASSSTSL